MKKKTLILLDKILWDSAKTITKCIILRNYNDEKIRYILSQKQYTREFIKHKEFSGHCIVGDQDNRVAFVLNNPNIQKDIVEELDFIVHEIMKEKHRKTSSELNLKATNRKEVLTLAREIMRDY